MMEQIRKLHSEDPGKFIKIRDILEDVVGIRSRFQDADVPFSWCTTKETVCQLQKAIYNCRSKSRSGYDDYPTAKKSVKSKKKGLFGLFK